MHASTTTRRSFVASSGVALAWTLTGTMPLATTLRSSLRSPVAGLTGRVIWPQDEDYDAARQTFNARFSRYPAAIVICDNANDVQNAVRWARRQNLPLRARSGGHSYEAFSTVDDGLVIDVSGLNQVVVDVSRGEAVVGSGVRLLDCYRHLWTHGVTIPGGTCPGVGMAGLTLGGGIGFLSRQYGLTCDNLLAVDLVDANGDLLRASEQEHADLFWALRGGGGGNFGIATAFTFRVHPVADVSIFTVSWPWHDVADVLDAWQHWAPFTDERLTVGFVVPSESGGVVTAAGQFTGSQSELETLIAPLLQAGTPSPPQIQSVPFITAVERFAGPDVAHSMFKNTGAFVYEPWSDDVIGTFVEQMRASPTNANVVGFFPWGGAIAAIDPAATAMVHRGALFDVQYQAYWHDVADEAADIAWVQAIRTAMLPYTIGDYVNYIDADIADWATEYYGANLARLEQVKAAYDPDDLFNGPQTIPLASGGPL